MRNFFIFIFFSDTDFFHRILIFFVIYTDFVLHQSGRSAYVACPQVNQINSGINIDITAFWSEFVITVTSTSVVRG